MEQTIEKLLHKEFSKKARGYDRDQVDNFLDEIIEDIEKLQKKYDLLLDEKKILEKNNFELKMKMLGLQEKMNSISAVSHSTIVGETKLEAPQQSAIQRQETASITNKTAHHVQIAPQKHVYTNPNTVFMEPEAVFNNVINFDEEFGQPVTHEDSNANDHTLQDRIEQLERELNNIKNFTD